MSIEQIKQEIKEQGNRKQAKLLQRFFKTGKGEYGEGDVFLGIKVPQQRKISKKYADELNIEHVLNLLNSKIHEERLIALLILIEKYKQAKKQDNEEGMRFIFDTYLQNTANINNWDLVDLSAPNIVGDFLLERTEERKILYALANSEDLWEKRISVISCFAFIKNREFEDALKISKILLKDKYDLIHKAVGWMLREIGKKNQETEEEFLKEDGRYKEMPRTMLRYAIEKFEEEKRKGYLIGGV